MSLPLTQTSLPLGKRTSCPNCRVGILAPRLTTHFIWIQIDWLTIPNFPVWLCDVCGHKEMDHQGMLWLQTILRGNAVNRSALFSSQADEILEVPPAPSL